MGLTRLNMLLLYTLHFVFISFATLVRYSLKVCLVDLGYVLRNQTRPIRNVYFWYKIIKQKLIKIQNGISQNLCRNSIGTILERHGYIIRFEIATRKKRTNVGVIVNKPNISVNIIGVSDYSESPLMDFIEIIAPTYSIFLPTYQRYLMPCKFTIVSVALFKTINS